MGINGNELQTTFLDDFFQRDEYHSLSDPVIVYDNSTNRWFSVIMEISPNPQGTDDCEYDCFIDVAVSLTNNPTGIWNIVRVPFEKNVLIILW